MVWVGRSSSSKPCHGQGHLPLNQAAPDWPGTLPGMEMTMRSQRFQRFREQSVHLTLKETEENLEGKLKHGVNLASEKVLKQNISEFL